MRAAGRGGLAALLTALAVLGLAAAGPAGASPASAPDADPPRCWGAASRDPARYCRNPALKHEVVPTPSQALLAPYSPCPTLAVRPLYVCGFRDNPEAPASAVALIGDSHAAHWRAALESVSELDWRGVSISRTGCPLTRARRVLDRGLARACRRWNREVPRYLRSHPEIETIFVSQNAGARVHVPAGSSQTQAQISGYHRAWKGLPDSVKHIVVIRDAPRTTDGSGDCVTRALRARRPPGTSCAVPRDYAVRPDTAVIAANRLRSKRVQVIDLTRFFCSPRLCPPVIGGVLVHKDTDHITTQWATSLRPFMLRHVRRLAAGWATG